METNSIEQLESVLPKDLQQQNDILKRLILTLRGKFNEQAQELQKVKDQLCAACNKQNSDSRGENNIMRKDLNAAVARAAAIQADYDALVAHFQQIRDKHAQTLAKLQILTNDNEKLRERNTDLVSQIQKQQVDLSKFTELQIMLTNCQVEKQRLEELQARTYAAQLAQQQKINELTQNSNQTSLQLRNKLTQLEIQQTEFESCKQENVRLRGEIARLFEVTSACSIQDLSEQINKLRIENDSLRQEHQHLLEQLNDEKMTKAHEIQSETKKILQKEQQHHQQLMEQQEKNYNELLNQQNLAHNKQIQEITNQVKDLQQALAQAEANEKSQASKLVTIQNQFQGEQQIYQNATQRAKNRNIMLHQQLTECCIARDELELRIQQLQDKIIAKDQEIQELKLLNKQFQHNSSNVFLQLKDINPKQQVQVQQTNNQQLQPITNNTVSQQNAKPQNVFNNMLESSDENELEVQTSRVQFTESQFEACNNEMNRAIQINDEEIVAYDTKNVTIIAMLQEFNNTKYDNSDQFYITGTMLDQTLTSKYFSVQQLNDYIMEQTIQISFNQKSQEILKADGLRLTLYKHQDHIVAQSGIDLEDFITSQDSLVNANLDGMKFIFQIRVVE